MSKKDILNEILLDSKRKTSISESSDFYSKLGETPKSVQVKKTDERNLLKMEEVANEISVTKNISSTIICVTEDKLELLLKEFCSDVEKKREFVTPLSLILTIIATLTTATFKDTVISASVAQAIFVIVLVICSVWLIKSLISGVKSSKKTDIKTIIDRISGGKK